MGKLVMAISAGITAFVLAITAAAIYTYRTLSSVPTVSAQTSPAQQSITLDMAAVPNPPETANVSPQDAASIASKFLNRTDAYSVELAVLQGTQAYKVTFSSGDVVYVGMKGDVLSAVPPPPPSVITSTSGGGGGGGGHPHGDDGGGSGGGGGGDDGGGGGGDN
jgi:uncharacterized membrane protein YgcG